MSTPEVTRRGLIGAAAAAATLPAVAVAARRKSATLAEPKLPDLAFLRATPLADRDRLSYFMRAAGIDALIVTHPANVFYTTNHWPQLDRMGLDGAGIAIVPADAKAPIALVMHAFLYYYTHTPESDFTDRAVFTYTQPDGPANGSAEPKAQAARTMRVVDEARVTPLDKHRVDFFARTTGPSADASWALRKAMLSLGLDRSPVGIDDPVLQAALELRGFVGTTAPGENVLRQARLAKSPAELKLMRYASATNVAAAMAAAGHARELGTSRRLRAEFYAEAARRGNSGHFMVIGGTSSEALDVPFVEGSSVSIDCVSTCRFYHGDFARSIFIGEPPVAVRRAVDAIQIAWQDIREALRPGMRFADVSRIGRESLKKQGADLSVSFTPHSVGLFHTDHPQPSLIAPRVADDLRLEANMVLSVDCPVFMAGLGGTLHYEDLMLIRDGPAEPIHAVPPPVIIV
jgi:Xaa-Pro aminopeptidase